MGFVQILITAESEQTGIVPQRCFWMGSFWARRVTSVLELFGCFTASTLYGRNFLKMPPKISVYRYETVPMMKKSLYPCDGDQRVERVADRQRVDKSQDEEDADIALEFFQSS